MTPRNFRLLLIGITIGIFLGEICLHLFLKLGVVTCTFPTPAEAPSTPVADYEPPVLVIEHVPPRHLRRPFDWDVYGGDVQIIGDELPPDAKIKIGRKWVPWLRVGQLIEAEGVQ